MRLIATLITSLFIAAQAFAAEPQDTLVIEVDGATQGVIEIELLPEVAPEHVSRIKQLARDGAYNGIVFHRVIEGFMAQTGDVKHGKKAEFIPRYAGLGGSNYPDLKEEFSDVPYVKGVVGMARSQDPNSANSQFFIMFADAPFLNNQYTVVGRVSAGQDVVDAIKRGDQAANGAVADPDFMKTVTIKSDN